ncbi:ArsR/SmtB family transcription factor [Nonomuraea cavernae]|uniref:Transcriptional regulator n=1 Tax=Nonomuraea cavernae TaxID=2045107 RepID=A0A918DKW3_9ACTN|nr:winged helix-turn-helix domain-containing protein [Nonomuraea cavernae]MCA2190483.1 winged helix-turn-helix domain-containing protein [Nonomuraea cavernae]GGO70595.1 transcriptional regulator [Nonomuraea cavernae]
MTRERESLSDPKAMRALAHPARLAILNKLNAGGSATATEVAEIAGITPSAASYHLRMLAKYGFVEDAPARGDGRERLWKSTDKPLVIGMLSDDQPEVREAKGLLIQAVRREAEEEVRRVLAGHDREPKEWRDVIRFNRTLLRVDATEMAWLNEQIEKLLQPYVARHRSEEAAPSGARIAEAQVNLFPRAERIAPGLPTEDHDAG